MLLRASGLKAGVFWVDINM